MDLVRLILLATLVSLVSACDLFGGDGGDDDSPPVTEAPPVALPPITEQAIHEPTVLEAPSGSPATVASYRIDPVGVFDEAGDDSAISLNEAGAVLGYTEGKQGHWIYKAGEVQRNVGITSIPIPPGEEIDFGSHRTRPKMNDTEDVIGSTASVWCISDCDDPLKSVLLGSDTAWLYRNGANVELGLAGLGSAGPGESSQALDINNAGQVCGITIEEDRQSAWLYSDGDYQVIDLTNSGQLGEAGKPQEIWCAINEPGDVVGASISDYSGDASCWLYSNATIVRIGMTDSEHTTNSGKGYCDSLSLDLNEVGHAIGTSWRFDTNDSLIGFTAWLYKDGSTIKIGLTDTDSYHTESNGYSASSGLKVNNSGQVAGLSSSYYGVNDSTANGGGTSAWFHDEGVTRDITLTGREYTRFDGRRESRAVDLNDAGHIIGYSTRYDPASQAPRDDLGQTAWLYKNGSHIKLGITDDTHTAADGNRYSIAKAINRSGQAGGHSRRFSPGLRPAPCFDSVCSARTAWFYDPDGDIIYQLALSARSDGFVFSEFVSLSEDGTMRGHYMAFEDGGDAFQWRMFTFSLEDGLQDVEVGGWSSWAEFFPPGLANDRGHFLGRGVSKDVGSADYLVSPLE